MRRVIRFITVLLRAAPIAPLAAQAHPNGENGLRVKLEPPVNFAPTPD